MKKFFFNPKLPSLSKMSTENSNTLSLPTLISEKKWKKVHDILTSEDKLNSYFNYRYECKKQCQEGHCLLHLALRFHPPSYIVQAMVELFPEGPSDTDCMKRYPLHIAAKYGTSAENVKILLEANPKAAKAIDDNGQTPLHLVFHDYSWKTKKHVEFGREFKRATFEVCRLLYKAAPKSVLIEVDGESIIEKAICEDVDIRVVKLLQKGARDALKEESYENNSAPVQKQANEVMDDITFLLKESTGLDIPSVGHPRTSIISPVLQEYTSRTA